MLVKDLELKHRHLKIKPVNSKYKIWNKKDLNLWSHRDQHKKAAQITEIKQIIIFL